MRVGIKTVGCRLNQAESAQIAASFRSAGYDIVDFDADCEVCIVHTCAVTRNAEQTCIRLARSAARRTPRPFVILAGCAAEVDADALREKSGADIVVGQEGKLDLVRRLGETRQRTGRQPRPTGKGPSLQGRANPPGEPSACSKPLPIFTTTRALVKVQDGCDFRCAYCIVPAARGTPHSIPVPRILDQVASLAREGYREVVLTGANLGCYADGSIDLVGLLARVAAIDGVDRIRLSSIEVTTTERAVIDFMTSCPKICRTLHLPVQSGDDRVLAAMGRRYTAAAYRELVAYAVEKLGDFGLGSDIIVGFPGEDEKAFANTVALVQELPFGNLHVFPYSMRPGTRAASMPGQVPPAEKKRRAAVLAGLRERKKAEFAQRFVGRPVEVLVERVGPNGATGWTSEYVAARIESQTAEPNVILRFTPERVEDGVLAGPMAGGRDGSRP